MQFNRPKAHFEVACDWMGQYGNDSRERFMIFSSGDGRLASMLSLGYSAYMYHFAGSEKARGVVDNILLNPFAKFDFGSRIGFQEFSMRLGWLQGMQHDRVFVGHYVFPCGAELDMDLSKGNGGLRNKISP